MTKLNHEAKVKYWASLTPDQKSLLMSQRRKKGWAKKSKEEKLAKGRALVEARLKKNNKK